MVMGHSSYDREVRVARLGLGISFSKSHKSRGGAFSGTDFPGSHRLAEDSLHGKLDRGVRCPSRGVRYWLSNIALQKLSRIKGSIVAVRETGAEPLTKAQLPCLRSRPQTSWW